MLKLSPQELDRIENHLLDQREGREAEQSRRGYMTDTALARQMEETPSGASHPPSSTDGGRSRRMRLPRTGVRLALRGATAPRSTGHATGGEF